MIAELLDYSEYKIDFNRLICFIDFFLPSKTCISVMLWWLRHNSRYLINDLTCLNLVVENKLKGFILAENAARAKYNYIQIVFRLFLLLFSLCSSCCRSSLWLYYCTLHSASPQHPYPASIDFYSAIVVNSCVSSTFLKMHLFNWNSNYI